MGDLASALVFSLAILRTAGIPPELGAPRCDPPPHELSQLLHDTGRRVRALTPRLASAIADGATRSPTLLGLLRMLQQNDVIVQMLDDPNVRPPTAAKLIIVPVPGPVRFVRVHVGHRRAGDGLVALLGHELVHALEVASDPRVRDAATLEALYRRIGFGLDKDRQYDSDAAHVVERQVRRELESYDEECPLTPR